MNHIHTKPAFAPGAAVVDNTAQVSTILDTLGFGSAVLAMVTGTLTDVWPRMAGTTSHHAADAMYGLRSAVEGRLQSRPPFGTQCRWHG